LLYDDLRDPVALLRGETEPRLRRYWAYAGAASPERIGTDAVAPYSDLMAASQPLVAAELLAAYPFQRHRTLLDLAGGDGRFLVEVGRRHPGLQLLLFDLPPVAAAAARRFEAEGLGGRARAVGGDLRTGPLPAGADLISLVRVIHDHDDEAALVILRAARGALAQGGTLLLAEPMAGTPGAETLEAYFAFYLLAMGQGRPRSADALQALLRAAGFGAVRPIATRMPLVTSLLAAHA
jgi:demethylspheroidene O-methyltransferase